MKICHMTSAHSPQDTRIFYKECVSLAKAGYEVYLVQMGESGEENGVHVIGVGDRSGGRLTRMTSFTKKVYQAALELDADLYQFHDPELLPYGLKLKKKGKKVIFDSHEDTLSSISKKEWIPTPLRKIIEILFGCLQKKVCSQLDAVISVTPSIVDYFKTINSRSIMVSNYPILRENVVLPSFQNKWLIFAGGIEPVSKHHIIIKAIEKNPDCRYCLCGIGEASYMQHLESLNGWKQVDYHGRIPHSEVAEKLSQSYIGLTITAYNPNGGWKMGTMGNTKIFEEMMAGLPVICTDYILWKEFVNRYHCGICVNPDSVDEIAAAIRYLLDHPEEARQMGENGRRAVKEEFNWGIEEKKLLTLYEEILNE